MAKQTINVGAAPNDRSGDPLRIAFTKANYNFDELYTDIATLNDAVSSLDNNIVNDKSWSDNTDKTFNVIEWNSGTSVTITATPFETANVVTYDARTDSEYIYFVWDQDFIDNVWEGWNTPAGEGQSYTVSLDNGITWIPAEKSGYNGGSFFYFWIPDEYQENYSFTYETGQAVLIRYNRGSLEEVWFDLSTVDVDNIIGVDMSVVVDATVSGDPDISAKIIRPNYRFMNVLYDDNTGEGSVNSGATIWSGSNIVEDSVRMSIRRNTDASDSGKIYVKYDNGLMGNISFYWNAKLYTVY
jgi:hypothetical protein